MDPNTKEDTRAGLIFQRCTDYGDDLSEDEWEEWDFAAFTYDVMLRHKCRTIVTFDSLCVFDAKCMASPI
jgi:hypothetical protein